MKVSIKEIEVGDIFSEEPHYVINKVAEDRVEFLHLESGKRVSLSNEHVVNLLNTLISNEYVVNLLNILTSMTMRLK